MSLSETLQQNRIRHAGNEKAIVSDLPDAILVLTTCSALIN